MLSGSFSFVFARGIREGKAFCILPLFTRMIFALSIFKNIHLRTQLVRDFKYSLHFKILSMKFIMCTLMSSRILLREHLDVICLQTSFFKQLIDYRGELGAHLSKVLPLSPFFPLQLWPYIPISSACHESVPSFGKWYSGVQRMGGTRKPASCVPHCLRLGPRYVATRCYAMATIEFA